MFEVKFWVNPTYPTCNQQGDVMATTVFADNAKVMSKGQVTIPKDVRAVLGVKTGDKVTFIVEGDVVRGQRSILRNTSAAAADGRGGRKS